LVGFVVLGGLMIWRGHAWPERRVAEVDPESPTLSAFVDSVARLYSRSRDHDRIFERYRALCLERIRRAIGLAPDTSAEVVAASLQARAGSWPELQATGLRDLLARRAPISSEAELLRAAGRLDDLVRVIRGGRARDSGCEAAPKRGSEPTRESGRVFEDPSSGAPDGADARGST
jgi:hypothetical protein